MPTTRKHVAALSLVGAALVALGALAWLQYRRPRLATLERRVHESTRALLEALAPQSPGRSRSEPWAVRLSPIAYVRSCDGGTLTIRKPEGWERLEDVRGFLAFSSDEDGADGVVPRVHILCVPAPPETWEEQLSALEEAGAPATGTCEWRRAAEPRVVPAGVDVEVVSTVLVPGRPAAKVAWYLFFRRRCTYVIAAAADERDFAALSATFLACARSMRFDEDDR